MKKKNKIETSKLMVALISIFGVLTVVAYYYLTYLGIMVDSAVAIAGMTEILVPVISYLIYQAKLKDSRNKYKVDKDGVPYEFISNYFSNNEEEFEYMSEDENNVG